MANSDEKFQRKFWNALDKSPFVMLALSGNDRGHSQPMTAQFDDDFCDQLYFFTSSDNGYVKGLQAGQSDAVVSFSSKGHDLFASLHGRLSIDNDEKKIDKFWSKTTAAWFDQGREDPKITLLRLDLGRAEIWEAGSGSFLEEMFTAVVKDNAWHAAKEHQTETRFAG